ncbi:MAG: 4a-hydroxytetrahydrobiopterin dehydratase [Candidatus Liptonbacteria bacterium]|nr:4a-hydroxytetrahydrobiopterin dehydratase [Candidatus Liptonbacteria bacterium]
MNNLKNQKCVPCEGGTPPLTREEAKKLLAQVSNKWQLDQKKIWADFKFKNFKEAMIFINKIAEIAEAEGHHPDIFISYSKVKIELWTHAVGGLSINDFILAAKIDQLT